MFNQKGIDERILFQRANPSVSLKESNINPYIKQLDGATKNSQGVLVIDPNKVINDYGQIADRYVKQENLIIFTSLQVIKTPERSVIVSDKGGKISDNTTDSIFINFLNPLKKKNPHEQPTFKDKLTSEWTDFFTSDSGNNKDSDNYILDSEAFGITDIEIKINANQLPIITMQFTDIQGRTLFEKGNDPNNPYNIFFTYPYPKFILTYKGYYGKAVETPLVLLSSNTSFDSSTGNYNVTAQFQSEMFSIFNTFLVIYGYVAPYMFLQDDGTYLGQKILASLYEKQNADIKALLNDDNEFKNYNITGNPTIFDLASAIKKIPSKAIIQSSDTNSASKANDIAIRIKYDIGLYGSEINNYFNTSGGYKPDNNDIFTPNSDAYKIDATKPNQLHEYIRNLNLAIKDIGTITLPSKNINYGDAVLTKLKADKDITNISANLNIAKVITPELFYYNKNSSEYSLLIFNKAISIIANELDGIQAIIEDTFISDQISDIGTVLGYNPNLNNILRIIANNMQTFLILLEIISQSSISQLESDKKRQNSHSVFTDYSDKNGNKLFTSFPNYYKKVVEYNNGKATTLNTLTYPGNDESNKSWFEVAFVEEIYTALDRIKSIATQKVEAKIEIRETELSTIFALGGQDLEVYNKKETSEKILNELITKYNLYMTYSGVYYRGLSNIDEFAKTFADFELDLIDRFVFSNLTTSNSKVLLAREIARITSSTEVGSDGQKLTSLTNFSEKYLGLTSSEYIMGVVPIIQTEIALYKTKYTKDKFDGIILNKNKKIGLDRLSSEKYKAIAFQNIDTPLSYSLNGGKKVTELSVYSNLYNNGTFYSNTQLIFDTLYGKVIGTKANTNPFQGFLINLNNTLGKNIENNQTLFNNQIMYRGKNIPALTFNAKNDILTIFPKITSNTKKYKTFNNI